MKDVELPQLPLSDSSHIGDTLLALLDKPQWNRDGLRATILQLKDIFHANHNDLDEDTLIERLFSDADIEFKNRGQQRVISLVGGKTCTIRTTEVVDNVKAREQDVQDEDICLTSNDYLVKPELVQATLYCCDEFLAWVLDRIDKPDLYGSSCVPFPFEAVYNFVQDLSATGLISGFCQSTTKRERQACTFSMFGDIENFTFFNCIPNNLTRDTMAIFALRQMLESWFMQVVGFRGVVPIDFIDIRSSRFQKIIENGFKENFHFPSATPPVSFQSIQMIYRWTQSSIHWAYSTNVWLLWKAITYCERLFGATIELSALENYRTEVIKLCLVESKFAKGTKVNDSLKDRQDKKERPDKRTILFRNPDIFVTDQGKRVNSYDVDRRGKSRLERNVIIRKNPQHGSDSMLT